MFIIEEKSNFKTLKGNIIFEEKFKQGLKNLHN